MFFQSLAELLLVIVLAGGLYAVIYFLFLRNMDGANAPSPKPDQPEMAGLKSILEKKIKELEVRKSELKVLSRQIEVVGELAEVEAALAEKKTELAKLEGKI